MKKEIENKKQLLKIKNEQKALASVPFSKSRKLTSDFNILKLHKSKYTLKKNQIQILIIYFNQKMILVQIII